jgi:hypothetical protein
VPPARSGPGRAATQVQAGGEEEGEEEKGQEEHEGKLIGVWST